MAESERTGYIKLSRDHGSGHVTYLITFALLRLPHAR